MDHLKKYITPRYHGLCNSSGTAVPSYDKKNTLDSIPNIPYKHLEKATANWSPENALGSGGFGTVFEAELKRTKVAVKRIQSYNANVQKEQSFNERCVLNACRHKNILTLMAYSNDGEFPCLVYEFMAGGSLFHRLMPSFLKRDLSFDQCVKIALGTALGLHYLHTFRPKPYIHGDIKPGNILLTEDRTPKIGEFGTVREGPIGYMKLPKEERGGTKPYQPKNFSKDGIYSTTVDTYSFGLVLYEMFTEKRVAEMDRNNNSANLEIDYYRIRNDMSHDLIKFQVHNNRQAFLLSDQIQ